MWFVYPFLTLILTWVCVFFLVHILFLYTYPRINESLLSWVWADPYWLSPLIRCHWSGSESRETTSMWLTKDGTLLLIMEFAAVRGSWIDGSENDLMNDEKCWSIKSLPVSERPLSWRLLLSDHAVCQLQLMSTVGPPSMQRPSGLSQLQ